MYRKRFLVRIDLELHAITCPGVWLCSHGYLEVTLKTLGYYFRTGAMEPRFPLLCHDHFTMEGYFKSASTLDELERLLAGEQLELTLWQNGRRLAYYVGKLADVLHATLPQLTCAHHVNVQLLMKATPAHPGIIAPKVELSAHVGIRDRLARSSGGVGVGLDSACGSRCSKYSASCHFIKPNFDFANGAARNNRHCQQSATGGSCWSYLEEPRRQRPVCHAKDAGASSFMQRNSSSTPCVDSSKVFEADMVAHKNEQRRLSTCSSHLSSQNSFATTQSADCSSSGGGGVCTHSLASHASSSTAEEHQQRCDICLSYRKAFL